MLRHHMFRTGVSWERQIGGGIRGQVMGQKTEGHIVKCLKCQAKGFVLFLVYSESLES